MKETKKSKVTNVMRNPSGDYNSKYGELFCWLIQFENGDNGEYHSKDNQECKFIVGQESAYEITAMMNKTNPQEVWKYIIKTINDNNNFSGYKKRELPIEDQKSIAMQISYECAIDLGVIIQSANIKFIVEKYFNWILSKGTEAGNQMRASSSLRLATRMLKIPELKNWKEDDVIKAADSLYNRINPENFKPIQI